MCSFGGRHRTLLLPGIRKPSGTSRIGLLFLSENIVSSFGHKYSPFNVRDFDKSFKSNCIIDPFLSKEKDVMESIPRERTYTNIRLSGLKLERLGRQTYSQIVALTIDYLNI
jgi:hypothetical protein